MKRDRLARGQFWRPKSGYAREVVSMSSTVVRYRREDMLAIHGRSIRIQSFLNWARRNQAEDRK